MVGSTEPVRIEPIRVVGLMSGTSADGIDAVLVEISEQPGLPARKSPEDLSIRTLAYANTPFDAELRERVFELFAPPSSTVDRVCQMNVVLGEAFAQAALRVIDAAGLAPEDVHLVGSHGQTIQHMPTRHATLQIGEAAVIAQRTGITTVSNFRACDMAAAYVRLRQLSCRPWARGAGEADGREQGVDHKEA